MGPGPAGLQQLQELVQRAINLSSVFAFLILTIMLVVGGLKLLLSGGDPKGIQGGQKTITWAILGLVFMAGAWVVLKVIEAFTGLTLTNFCLALPGAALKCQ